MMLQFVGGEPDRCGLDPGEPVYGGTTLFKAKCVSEELRPYIEGIITNIRAPVGVLKKVACFILFK